VYRLVFWLILRRLPPETADHVSRKLLRWTMAIPGTAWGLRKLLVPSDPELQVKALGFELASPLGLAAGFDKDATSCDALALLGFGFIEAGGVTHQPQPGNPQPRLFRLIRDRALINRMGFNHQGAAAAAERLRRRDRLIPVGINIARTRSVTEGETIADYVASTELLAGAVDFAVINVSSPNTPGMRDLQATERLRPLLEAIRTTLDRVAPARLPLLVKIAPDLADDDIDAIADLCLELRVDGIVATNTTVSREGLTTDPAAVEAIGPGGLSGSPLARRSLEVLRRLRARTGNRMVLISVGGIETADDAWERICAGATLIQAFTGLVYGGPLWPRRLNRGLADRVRKAGLKSVGEAVGIDAVSGETPKVASL
jgi:dihydroorotate dehydrogenase